MQNVTYTYTRRRLFSGFDGEYCKIQPAVAFDGKDTALLSYQMLLLTGSDVFYGQYIAKSTDGGKTFGEPMLQTALQDTYANGIRTAYYGVPLYSRKNKRWFGLGNTCEYVDDTHPVLNKNGLCTSIAPLYLHLDEESGMFTGCSPLPFPFEAQVVVPMRQFVELENGDILIPFSFIDGEDPEHEKVVTVRYAFTESGLSVVQAGTPLADASYNRGFSEPSLAYLKGKYYLTIRTDEIGLMAESDDGYTFSKPTPWVWEDGSALENYNTQQHWVRHKDGLFLTYTRRGAHNDHVFRHRAPIFMTRFDEDRNCLLREEEIILVPELGARLGNFNVIEATEEESWLITAEWMQPLGCEKYGSDNSLWLAKIRWQ